MERRSSQAAAAESSPVEEAVNEMLTSFVKLWQGAAVEDRKERTGKWDTRGLASKRLYPENCLTRGLIN